jgi:hypothetical protein
MKIFHAKKGHFAPGKRALAKTWGGLAAPPPVPTPLTVIIFDIFSIFRGISPISHIRAYPLGVQF